MSSQYFVNNVSNTSNNLNNRIDTAHFKNLGHIWYIEWGLQ